MNSLGNINLNNFTPGTTYSDTILFNDVSPHMYDNWNISGQFNMVDSFKWGFGLIGMGSGGGNRDVGFFVDSINGKISFEYWAKGGTSTFILYKSQNFSIVTGRNYNFIYRVNISRRYQSAFIQDTVNGNWATITYTPTTLNQMLFPLAYFGMLKGGVGSPQITINNLKIYVEDKLGGTMFVGDSITTGYKLPLNALSYPRKFCLDHDISDGNVWAAGSSTHDDINQTLISMVGMQPSVVYIMLGDNDESQPPFLWIPTRQNITDVLVASGSQVIQLQMTPEKVFDNTSSNNAILSVYPNALNVRSPLYASGSSTIGDPQYYVDNVHLNKLGNITVASNIT